MNTTVKQSEIEFTRINNDINGNPRYVCHFLNLLNDADKQGTKLDAHKYNMDRSNDGKLYVTSIDIQYERAIKKARKIGGKRFHNKQYGGGIVFQSYSLPELERLINEAKNS